jgi:general stress protein CsbA
VQPLLAWLTFLGYLPLIIRGMVNGTLSPEVAAILLLVIVVAVRAGVKKFYSKIVVPIVGVVLFASQYSKGDTNSFWAILSAVFTLSLIMLGFYIMISGFFRTKHNSR